MCTRALERCLWSLEYIPDWYVTQQQIRSWCDDDDYCNYDKLIRWYDGYKKGKGQKVQIKEELMPIAWHPSRYWDWCMSEDKKQDTENFWR